MEGGGPYGKGFPMMGGGGGWGSPWGMEGGGEGGGGGSPPFWTVLNALQKVHIRNGAPKRPTEPRVIRSADPEPLTPLQNLSGRPRTSRGASVVTNETHLVLQNLSRCSRTSQGVLMVTNETHLVIQNLLGCSRTSWGPPEDLGAPQW